MKVLSTRGFGRIVQALSRKEDVAVKVGNYHPSTNGKEIFLPLKKDGDQQYMEVMLGYVIHEIGHVTETDFKVENKGLCNLFEDHRIERKQRSKFAGAEESLLKAHQRIWETWVGGETTPFGAVSNYLLAHGQKVIMGRSIPQECLDESLSNLKLHWGEVSKDLDRFLLKSFKTQSTKDCAKLSEEILSFLRMLEDNPSSSKNKGNSEGNAEDNSENQEQNPFTSEALKKAQEELEKELKEGAASPDFGESLMEELKDIHDEASRENKLATESDVFCRAREINLDSLIPNQEIAAKVSRIALSMQKAVAALTASSKAKKIPSSKGKRLIARKLHTVATGNTRVFERTSGQTKAQDAAITIAVDLSSSMRIDDRAASALACSLGVAKAIQLHSKASVRITGFGGDDIKGVKELKSRYALVDDRITGAVVYGNTPLYHMLEEAYGEIQETKSTKKTIIVFTDVEVASQDVKDTIEGLEAHVISGYRAKGVEVLWIGISSSLSFKNSIRVDDIDLLGEAMLGHLKGSL